MEKIKRFVECLIPVTACNLRCEYCYIIQEGRRSNNMPKMRYSAEQIGKALSVKRMGGVCYFSICGAGETLLPKETVEIVYALLKEGHFVNITTNGTITKRFNEITEFPQEYLERLHFAFSLHYLELKQRDLLDCFINNVKKMREMGCSYLIQMNLYDGYIPYMQEIEQFCLNHFGAKPQVAATRDESCNTFKLYTHHSTSEYKTIGMQMDSPLFEFTMKNFMVRRKEYCYAGDWSFILDLDTGIMRRCYNKPFGVDIFADPQKPISFEAVGRKCGCEFCVNSSHFLSLGVIPELNTPTYASLRNRNEANWYSKQMNEFLSGKLADSNQTYSTIKKAIIVIKDQYRRKRLFLQNLMKR